MQLAAEGEQDTSIVKDCLVFSLHVHLAMFFNDCLFLALVHRHEHTPIEKQKLSYMNMSMSLGVLEQAWQGVLKN